MPKRCCVTNNPLWKDRYEDVRFIDGTSQEVFEAARDLIHKGWKFLGHPLYGNFKPSKQPYRTLALETTSDGGCAVDLDSFAMLELALDDRAPPLKPEDVPEAMRHDFAMLDVELMKDTLERYFRK